MFTCVQSPTSPPSHPASVPSLTPSPIYSLRVPSPHAPFLPLPSPTAPLKRPRHLVSSHPVRTLPSSNYTKKITRNQHNLSLSRGSFLMHPSLTLIHITTPDFRPHTQLPLEAPSPTSSSALPSSPSPLPADAALTPERRAFTRT